MKEAKENLIQASAGIVDTIGYIRRFQNNNVKITDRQLNSIIAKLQKANLHIGYAANDLGFVSHEVQL